MIGTCAFIRFFSPDQRGDLDCDLSGPGALCPCQLSCGALVRGAAAELHIFEKSESDRTQSFGGHKEDVDKVAKEGEKGGG